MTLAGKRLLQAANEALSIAKGEADSASYLFHAPPAAVDVRAIRKSMDMTQKTFGLRFGFGPARIRDWEQGRTRPAASDRVLLTTIQREPDAVLRALATQMAVGETNMAAVSFETAKGKTAEEKKTTAAKKTVRGPDVKKIFAKKLAGKAAKSRSHRAA